MKSHFSTEANLTASRIDDICAALGYDAANVPNSIEQIHEVHTATTVASTRVEFSVMGQDDFRGKKKPPSSGSPPEAKNETTYLNGPPQVQESSNFHSHCVQGKYKLPFGGPALPMPVSPTLERNRQSVVQESLSQMSHSSDRNIRNLCKTEQNAVFLLLLLRFLVESVKLDTQLLGYAGSARTRWATSGEMEIFKTDDIGLDQVILDLVMDSTDLQRNLGLLNSLALISSEPCNSLKTIWLDDDLSHQIDQLINSSVKMYWREQALILTSYFFMGNGYTKL